jgi:hypothetical protein
MRNSIRSLVFFFGLAIVIMPVGGCKSRSAVSVPANRPPLSGDACRRWAAKVEKTITAGDGSFLTNSLDWTVLAQKVVGPLGIPKESEQGLIAGMKSNGQIGDAVCQAIGGGGKYKCIAVRQQDGRWKALFRMTGGGFNYHDFHLEGGADGEVKIIDMYIAVTGELFTETIGRSFAGIFNKGKGMNAETQQMSIVMAAYGKYMASDQPGLALKELDKLPEQFRKQKWCLAGRRDHAPRLQLRSQGVRQGAGGVGLAQETGGRGPLP